MNIALDADDQASAGIEVGDTVLLPHISTYSTDLVSSDGRVLRSCFDAKGAYKELKFDNMINLPRASLDIGYGFGWSPCIFALFDSSKVLKSGVSGIGADADCRIGSSGLVGVIAGIIDSYSNL